MEHDNGLPPYVVPCIPALSNELCFSFTQNAPIGIPPPNDLAMEIYCGKDHKWTFRGSPEKIRLEAYKMCKKVGATLNPRKGKKTNTDFTFRIFVD